METTHDTIMSTNFTYGQTPEQNNISSNSKYTPASAISFNVEPREKAYMLNIGVKLLPSARLTKRSTDAPIDMLLDRNRTNATKRIAGKTYFRAG